MKPFRSYEHKIRSDELYHAHLRRILAPAFPGKSIHYAEAMFGDCRSRYFLLRTPYRTSLHMNCDVS